MATTSSGRIDITGQTGLCGSELTVSRTMPAVLVDRMSDSSWASFCNKLDKTLVPATKARKNFLICFMVGMALTIVMIIISMASFISSSRRAMDRYSSGSSRSPALSFIPFFLAFVGICVGLPITICWLAKVGHQAEDEMSKVCGDASAMHPGISFHLRKERYITGQGNNLRSATSNYIEVCVMNTAAGINPPANEGIVASKAESYMPGSIPPTAPGYISTASAPAQTVAIAVADEPEMIKSAVERMRELDQMKELLTEDEYQRKRAEILSDV